MGSRDRQIQLEKNVGTVKVVKDQTETEWAKVAKVYETQRIKA